MLIRFAQYRAGIDGKVLDNFISLWTGLFTWDSEPYSHSEVWWPDEYGNFDKGEAFTSTMRGKVNGTVIRPALEVFRHPQRWDYFEIEVEDEFAFMAIAMARMAAKNNQGYDKPAILSFFCPWRFGSEGKDICSEVAKRYAMWCNLVDNDRIESPRKWGRTLTRLGHKAKRLSLAS